MVLALTAACAPTDRPNAAASEGYVEKSHVSRYTRTADNYDATLSVNDRTGMLILAVTARVANPGVRPSMSSRLTFWKPLLDQLFREHGRQPEYLLAVGDYPELRRRMAEAAICLGDWDPKTGRPRAGRAGPALKTMLARERLYQELDSFFGSMGYLVAVDHVEGVMICPWKNLGDLGTRCAASGEADSLVPCGALIIFKLSRADATPR